jgi:hypothetical protein
VSSQGWVVGGVVVVHASGPIGVSMGMRSSTSLSHVLTAESSTTRTSEVESIMGVSSISQDSEISHRGPKKCIIVGEEGVLSRSSNVGVVENVLC